MRNDVTIIGPVSASYGECESVGLFGTYYSMCHLLIEGTRLPLSIIMERREVAGISLYALARIKFSVEELLPFIDVAGLATEGDVNAEVVLKKLRENVSCPQSLSQTLYLDYLYNEGTDGSAWQYSKPQEASPDYLRRAFSNPDATVKNRMSKLGHRIDTDHAFFGPERSPWQ